MLIDVASGSGPGGRSETPTTLTSLSSSCLIALSVARGEAELILSAVASLIMSPSALADQYLQVTFAHSIYQFSSTFNLTASTSFLYLDNTIFVYSE